jgi:hypothetical protein
MHTGVLGDLLSSRKSFGRSYGAPGGGSESDLCAIEVLQYA